MSELKDKYLKAEEKTDSFFMKLIASRWTLAIVVAAGVAALFVFVLK